MATSTESIETFLKNIGVGIRSLNDPFLSDAHYVCKINQRTGVTVEDEEQLCHQMMNEFNCNALGCRAKFRNLLDYEVHYNSIHRFTCAECKKIKPNARLLEIHIQEVHDSFFKILSEKEPMYQCFVSDCNIKFKDAAERKQHCIDLHKFSKLFKYEETSQMKKKKDIKIDKKSEMSMDIDKVENNKKNKKKSQIYLNKNQKAKTFIPNMKNSSQVSCEDKPHPLPEQRPTIASALQFVPRQLTHKSYSKVLTQNKIFKRTNIDSSNMMMELGEALPL